MSLIWMLHRFVSRSLKYILLKNTLSLTSRKSFKDTLVIKTSSLSSRTCSRHTLEIINCRCVSVSILKNLSSMHVIDENIGFIIWYSLSQSRRLWIRWVERRLTFVTWSFQFDLQVVISSVLISIVGSIVGLRCHFCVRYWSFAARSSFRLGQFWDSWTCANSKVSACLVRV